MHTGMTRHHQTSLHVVTSDPTLTSTQTIENNNISNDNIGNNNKY